MLKSRIVPLLVIGLVLALLAAGWFLLSGPSPDIEAPPPSEPVPQEAVASAEWLDAFRQQMALLQQKNAVFEQLLVKAEVVLPDDVLWQQQYSELKQLDALAADNKVTQDQVLEDAVALLRARIQNVDAQIGDVTELLHEKVRAKRLQAQWDSLVQKAHLTPPSSLQQARQALMDEANAQAARQAFVAATQQWQQLSGDLSALIKKVHRGTEARDRAQEQRRKWQSIEANEATALSAQAAALFQSASNQLHEVTDDAGVATFDAAADVWQEAWRDGLVREATPRMLAISAGHFRMGDLDGDGKRDQQPAHGASVNAFKLAATETTFKQFAAYAVLTNQALPSTENWGEGHRPVINVTWQQAVDYAAWLSAQTGRHFRLPTETEWEYAARAGTESAFIWGDIAPNQMANCEGCNRWGNDRTLPVGSFKPNAFGLYDMSGNVWEWTSDCYRARYDEAVAAGDCAERVLRGGSWADLPGVLKVANRSRAAANVSNNRIGFRLAEGILVTAEAGGSFDGNSDDNPGESGQ